MPLTDTANPVEAPQGSEWKPIPEDIYQVVIKDIDEKIMKKYQSEEEEAFYHFKFVILDGSEETNGQMVSTFATRKWFSGNKKASPSKLVTLVKAVYAFYYPQLSVVELEADDMSLSVVNDLIGKQLRIAVKLNADGTNNKITEFMAIKKELDLSDTIVIAEVPKKMLAKPASGIKKAKTPSPDGEDKGDDMPF